MSANEAQAGFDAMGTYSQPAPTDGPTSKNIVGSAARGPSPDATFDVMGDFNSANQQSVPTSVKHIV